MAGVGGGLFGEMQHGWAVVAELVGVGSHGAECDGQHGLVVAF
ncbi:hypothetical protein [Streptomyces sp. NPDC058086]